MKKMFFALACTLLAVSALAQSVERMVKLQLAPQHADWKYKTGENVKFNLEVTMNSVPLKDVEIRYQVAEDMMKPLKEQTLTLKDGTLMIDAGTMKKPGFLRCQVFATYKGTTYEGRATAAFEPENIEPTTTLPADFVQFWDKAKAEAAKVPMNPNVTLVPERCTASTNVYLVQLQNYEPGNKLYGILTMPKAPGKYPAVLKVPGAGVRPYGGDLSAGEKGVILFEIGIHGIPVNLPQQLYDDLRVGALKDYWFYHLEDKDKYYYKRVYLGCVRAVDFIFSLPEFDGENVAVQGGSQGGALSIVTAALDPRIKCLASFFPALCDHTGYLNGRAGGWPRLFQNANPQSKALAEQVETSKYYDVVNFARQIKVPGFYSFGYNDMVCPPTSMFSAYNVVAAPKTLLVMEETAHFAYPEQWNESWDFMMGFLKK